MAPGPCANSGGSRVDTESDPAQAVDLDSWPVPAAGAPVFPVRRWQVPSAPTPVPGQGGVKTSHPQNTDVRNVKA